jgi:hypothetical protein
VEELEGVQALEKDKLALVNRNMDVKLGELENMMKTMLAMAQQTGSAPHSHQHIHGDGYERKTEGILGKPGSMPKWGRSVDNEKCFYCGHNGHFLPDCADLKEDLRIGKMKIGPDARIRMGDGSRIPPGPMGTTIKERVERSQHTGIKANYYGGVYEEEDDIYVPALARITPQYALSQETQEQRTLRLEKELDLREREDALELRKLKLAREEKKVELTVKASREANIQELLGQFTDEEIASIKAAKAGFV